VMVIFFWLLVGHSLADYPLQGEFLALAKRRGGMRSVPWQTALAAHSTIHAGAVALVTGSVILGLFEFAFHSLIDFAKCEGMFGEDQAHAFSVDQGLHVVCKLMWVAAVFLKSPIT
jgi:hypothetical protein